MKADCGNAAVVLSLKRSVCVDFFYKNSTKQPVFHATDRNKKYFKTWMSAGEVMCEIEVKT